MTDLGKFALDRDGFCVVSDVYSEPDVECLRRQVETGNARDSNSALRSRGTIFAARNLIDSIPDLLNRVTRQQQLSTLLADTLGAGYGLVRVLYFDKPADRSWNLPFHKDLTIAVKDNSLPSEHFSKATRKGGVDHVEASREILDNMLTLRIHLDQVTARNGPLEVVPQSHLTGKENLANLQSPVKVLVSAGDVLAMRPLLSHASGHTEANSDLRRRILHLEFCGTATLPDGYQWMHFLRSSEQAG